MACVFWEGPGSLLSPNTVCVNYCKKHVYVLGSWGASTFNAKFNAILVSHGEGVFTYIF